MGGCWLGSAFVVHVQDQEHEWQKRDEREREGEREMAEVSSISSVRACVVPSV